MPPPAKRRKLQCAVCSRPAASYRCPADDTPYCSLGCFKTHKDTVCAKIATVETPEPSEAPSLDPPDEPAPAPIVRLKRLQDLDWPREPDSALWDDPLARDDVKPLRRSEYEAIGAGTSTSTMLTTVARSKALRDVLRADPSLAAVLKRVQGRTEHIRALLSLPPSAQSRGPLPGFLPEEQAAAQKFARAIADALDVARGTGETPNF